MVYRTYVTNSVELRIVHSLDTHTSKYHHSLRVTKVDISDERKLLTLRSSTILISIKVYTMIVCC